MALLALVATVGLILAIARRPPPAIVLTLAFLGGAALMLSAPPQATTTPAAIAAQIGTGIAALASSGAIALVTTNAKQGWQRIGTRIAGSWIAASAILVLALRLTR